MENNTGDMQEIKDGIRELSELVKSLGLSQKEMFSVEELVIYTGLSLSMIYKLVREKTIPFYKPVGKLFFKRTEIDAWLQQNRTSTKTELDSKAQVYCMTRPAAASKKR